MRSAQDALLVAMSEEPSDIRRAAVIEVAASRQHDADWAFEGLTVLALLESDEPTRAAAIRGLGRSEREEAVKSLLMILDHETLPETTVRPPGEVSRWEAALALAARCPDGMSDALFGLTRTALSKQLIEDDSRNVRIEAARGLGRCDGDALAVRALLNGLDDAEFVVAKTCAEALVRMTGQDFGVDARAWRSWCEAHPNELFANAGQTPESRESRPTGMRRTWRDTKRFFRGE